MIGSVVYLKADIAVAAGICIPVEELREELLAFLFFFFVFLKMPSNS